MHPNCSQEISIPSVLSDYEQSYWKTSHFVVKVIIKLIFTGNQTQAMKASCMCGIVQKRRWNSNRGNKQLVKCGYENKQGLREQLRERERLKQENQSCFSGFNKDECFSQEEKPP